MLARARDHWKPSRLPCRSAWSSPVAPSVTNFRRGSAVTSFARSSPPPGHHASYAPPRQTLAMGSGSGCWCCSAMVISASSPPPPSHHAPLSSRNSTSLPCPLAPSHLAPDWSSGASIELPAAGGDGWIRGRSSRRWRASRQLKIRYPVDLTRPASPAWLLHAYDAIRSVELRLGDAQGELGRYDQLLGDVAEDCKR